MATMKAVYIPSVNAGYHWQITNGKAPGRPAWVMAIEGTVREGAGYVAFEWKDSLSLLGAKRNPATRVEIEGPATKAKIAAAVNQLRKQLEEAGLINADGGVLVAEAV